MSATPSTAPSSAPSTSFVTTGCNLCIHCNDSNCRNLHQYYLMGAICTIVGSLFMILSYLCNEHMRQHPSVLIFARCFFDFLFGLCFIVIQFPDLETLTCDDKYCNRWGPIMLFLFLCSNGYFAASVLDLFMSVKNPFSSPHSFAQKSHAVVLGFSALGVTTVLLSGEDHGNVFSYRGDIQFCLFNQSNNLFNTTTWIFIFLPVLSLIIGSFMVNVYAFLRLRKGLPDTFAIRMRSVQDSLLYSVGYFLYYVPLAIMYTIIVKEDLNDMQCNELLEHDAAHKVFAVIFGFLGVNDYIMWYLRKFIKRGERRIKDKKMMEMASLTRINDGMSIDDQIEMMRRQQRSKQKIRTTIKSRSDLKHALIPERPSNLYKSEHRSPKHLQNSNKLCPLNPCIKLKQMSFKPSTKGSTINKALRREVLAYTTDGIAQSVDRASKLWKIKIEARDGLSEKLEQFEGDEQPEPAERKCDSDSNPTFERKYAPETIDDPHGETIQRFGIFIQHNVSLLYRDNCNNIVTDSQLISLPSCFGSHALDGAGLLDTINPPSVHEFSRVATNLVTPTEQERAGLFANLTHHHDRESRERDAHYSAVERMGKERQFVDFAPLLFRYIRQKLLNMTDEMYRNSIIPQTEDEQKEVLDAKFGDGKSGAFFYFTHDSRFLVKTLRRHEVQLFLDILPDYVKHLKRNPNTILSRCVGLHSLKIYGLTKYFVVMENVFLADLKPHEVYDLKGSWVGRQTNHGIEKGKIMKDNDLKRFIILSKSNRKQILNQLKRDTGFLERHRIIDYSLLLGIYHMKICNAEQGSRLRERSYIKLELDDEEPFDHEQQSAFMQHNGLSPAALQPMEREHSHNTYAGGVQAHVIEGPGIYYMGIIDALQKYTLKKKLETLFKTYVQRLDGDGISCVDPRKYRERFMNYMENIIINENEYFQELDIRNHSLEEQTMYVYPPKNVVDSNMTRMREKRTIDWTLSPPALSPAATLDLHSMQSNARRVRMSSKTPPALVPSNSAPALVGSSKQDTSMILDSSVHI